MLQLICALVLLCQNFLRLLLHVYSTLIFSTLADKGTYLTLLSFCSPTTICVIGISVYFKPPSLARCHLRRIKFNVTCAEINPATCYISLRSVSLLRINQSRGNSYCLFICFYVHRTHSISAYKQVFQSRIREILENTCRLRFTNISC